MEEARRFLRYVTPAVVLLLETIVLVLVLEPAFFNQLIEFINKLDGSKGFALLAAGLVGSGAIGFTLGAIHHLAMVRIPRWGYNHVAFVQLVQETFPRAVAYVPRHKQKRWHWPGDERILALQSVGALWYHFRAEHAGFEVVESKMKSLSDLTHGMGAATVAAFFAPIASWLLFLHLNTAGEVPAIGLLVRRAGFWGFIGLSFLSLGLFGGGYLRARNFTVDLFERSLWASLYKKREALGLRQPE